MSKVQPVKGKTANAVPQEHPGRELTFELNLSRRWLIALVVGFLTLYAALAWGAWQGAVSSEWLRLGAAWVIFLAPGLLLQQILWRDTTSSQRLIVGFGVSVALGGLFGVVATALHLALWFVIGAMTLVTVGCAILLAARNRWEVHSHWHFRISVAPLLMLLPITLAGLIVVRLTYGLAFDTDDLTYTAYVTRWLEAAQFSWNELPLGAPHLAPTRLWLAYWTLNQALLAHWSGLHGFELTRFFLAPGLGLAALLATYALARALNFSRVVSGFALTMQVGALLLLTSPDQAGVVFFNRLVEDKVITAFVLIPVFGIAVTAFLKEATRGRLALVALTGSALVLTHPTLMAVGVAAVALFTLVHALALHEWRKMVVIAVVCIFIMSVPVAMRVLDTNYTEKIPFGAETLQRNDQLRRMVEWGNLLYAAHPNLYLSLPFAWVLVSALLSLFEWRRSYAARWMLATTIVLVSVANPLTGGIWGLAIGASQLWRVLWFTPFGIGAAFLVLVVWQRGMKSRASLVSVSQRRAALALGSTVFLLGGLVMLSQGANAAPLQALRGPSRVERGNYAKFLAFKPQLDAHLSEPMVVVGGDRWLNDRLPSLSANARIFAFRSELNMWQLSNLTWDEAVTRWRNWRKLQQTKTLDAERLAILDEYGVRYIVAKPGTTWVNRIVAFAPERVEYLGTYSSLELYRLHP